MNFKSNFWYQITYPNGETLFFQFLDISADGRPLCRLCNGELNKDVFLYSYSLIKEIGKNSPCQK